MSTPALRRISRRCAYSRALLPPHWGSDSGRALTLGLRAPPPPKRELNTRLWRQLLFPPPPPHTATTGKHHRVFQLCLSRADDGRHWPLRGLTRCAPRNLVNCSHRSPPYRSVAHCWDPVPPKTSELQSKSSTGGPGAPPVRRFAAPRRGRRVANSTAVN